MITDGSGSWGGEKLWESLFPAGTIAGSLYLKTLTCYKRDKFGEKKFPVDGVDILSIFDIFYQTYKTFENFFNETMRIFDCKRFLAENVIR